MLLLELSPDQQDSLFFAAIAVIIIAVVIWKNRLWLLSRGWPMHSGRFYEGSVNVGRQMILHVFPIEIADVELSYNYAIDGEYYAGYYKKQFFDEQKAWDFVNQMKGREVSIRYSPRHPEESVFEGLIEFGTVVRKGV